MLALYVKFVNLIRGLMNNDINVDLTHVGRSNFNKAAINLHFCNRYLKSLDYLKHLNTLNDLADNLYQ